jgi:serine/threonine protein phosphatase PrpC
MLGRAGAGHRLGAAAPARRTGSEEQRVELNCAGMSDIGRTRAANEDFFATDLARGLFVVADGLGGHAAGRVAAETGVRSFLSSMAQSHGADPLAALRACARAANRAILERTEGEPALRGMATTLAALWWQDGEAVLAHVGDSRIYLLRERVLHQLTMDHSYVCDLVFRGRIAPEQARRHPNRHVIMRALGVAPPAEPDLSCIRPEPGDLFLLCTDGVHSQLVDEEIRSALLECAPDLDRCARALVSAANDRGGQDNATVILVQRA